MEIFILCFIDDALLHPQLMKLGGYTGVSRRSVHQSGGSVSEILCLELLPQFSSHLDKNMLHMIPMVYRHA